MTNTHNQVLANNGSNLKKQVYLLIFYTILEIKTLVITIT